MRVDSGYHECAFANLQTEVTQQAFLSKLVESLQEEAAVVITAAQLYFPRLQRHVYRQKEQEGGHLLGSLSNIRIE